MSLFRNILLIFFVSLSLTAFAQTNDPLDGRDTIVLENERIEDVIDSEKPFIKPPYQEIKTGSTEEIQYESKDFYVETAFQPVEPKIRNLDKEKKENLTNNHLRLGVGRFLTPLAQLYINNGRDREVDYGLSFQHLSAHKDVIPLRRFREDFGTATFAKISKDITAQGRFHLYNTAYFYYAGDDSTLIPGPAAAREDSLKMGFTRVDVSGQLFSNYNPKEEVFYDAGAGIKFYRDRFTNSELHLAITPSGGYRLRDDTNLHLGTELNYIRGNIGGIAQNRFFAELTPSLNFDNETFSLKAGVRFNYFGNSIDTVNYSNLGPMVEVGYEAVPDQLKLIVGLSSGMTNNSYYDMIYENRYLNRSVDIRPTTETINAYFAAEGNISQYLDYSAKVFYKRNQNQLMYVNNDSITFTALYDSLMTTTGAHVEINYDLEDGLQLGGALNLNVYNTSNQNGLTPKYFHAAPIRLDLYGAYVIQERVKTRAELFVFGPTPMKNLESGAIESRNAYLDLNLHADVRITDAISVFLSVNNLLNSNYQRWYNYPERKIDIMGGITASF
ncbi:MAG: TonB-dependent receptor [Bacteroidota bacterium]